MVRKKNMLVLGGSYLQSFFIKTALGLGYEVHVLDMNPNCFVANDENIVFEPINIADFNEVETYFNLFNFSLVISPVSEIGNRTACYLCNKYGLIYNSIDSVKATTDKTYMREKLRSSPLIEPKVARFTTKSEVLANFNFPFIVKPPVSSASRGVTLVKDLSIFDQAIAEAKEFVENTDEILIEEYLEGEQFSIETISFGGKHKVVALTREILSGSPYFMERMDVISKTQNYKYWNNIETYINVLLTDLGVTVGPCHIEIKLKDDEFRLIEVASRSGLLRDQLISTANGANYNELIIKSYEGVDILDVQKPNTNSYLGVIVYPEDYKVYERLKSKDAVAEYYFNGNEYSENPKRLTDAVGYFFVESNDESFFTNYTLIL